MLVAGPVFLPAFLAGAPRLEAIALFFTEADFREVEVLALFLSGGFLRAFALFFEDALALFLAEPAAPRESDAFLVADVFFAGEDLAAPALFFNPEVDLLAGFLPGALL